MAPNTASELSLEDVLTLAKETSASDSPRRRIQPNPGIKDRQTDSRTTSGSSSSAASAKLLLNPSVSRSHHIMSTSVSNPELYWSPGGERVHSDEEAFMDVFRKHVNKKYGYNFENFWDLHKWSVAKTSEFWGEVWDYFGVIGEKGPGPYHDPSVPMSEPQNWFPGSQINVAENLLLAHPNALSKTAHAVISTVEPDPTSANPTEPVEIGRLTYFHLYHEVRKAVHALKKLGVKPGDSVVTFAASNCEMIIIYLAVVSVGAIFSSTPAEFGAHAVIDRYSIVKPKVLFTIDSYRYGKKTHDVSVRAREVVEQLTKIGGLEQVVVIGHLAQNRRPSPASLKGYASGPTVRSWQDFMGLGSDAPEKIPFRRAEFSYPIWIVFSSGTTGKPKSIYGPGTGILLMRYVTFLLHMNMDHRDVNFQFSTMGWIVYNLHIQYLATGGTVLTYDGSPFHPQEVLWTLVSKYKANQMGVSPRYIQSIARTGFEPRAGRDLSSVKQLYLTGAPVTSDCYDFVANKLGNIYINNNAGGTELGGSFMHGNPVLPIYKSELQAPTLGMDVAVVSEGGERLIGQEGTLVFMTAFPNMPTGFVDDAGRKRYLETYFSDFKAPIFNMNDNVRINPRTGGASILGRADGVLNPSGVRFGSAELYQILETKFASEIEESLAVGQKDKQANEHVILFVKTMNNSPLSQDLIKRVGAAISAQLSRRHVPAMMVQCPEVPVTMTGKKIEASVKKIINGYPLSGISRVGVQNPEAYKFYSQWYKTTVEKQSKL
ncbi:acetyl-CoA synthetase-like protein [Meredithblackwellia eburnea MCA 4105]